MPAPSTRPAADNGDVYLDAAREVARESMNPAQEALDADRDAERIADGDPDVVLESDRLASGAGADGLDDDDTIGDTPPAADDPIR